MSKLRCRGCGEVLDYEEMRAHIEEMHVDFASEMEDYVADAGARAETEFIEQECDEVDE